jgi:hypothetical protein
LVYWEVEVMETRLEELIEEKRSLQTQLVQIESMLYTIDDYISEEILSQTESSEKPNPEN